MTIISVVGPKGGIGKTTLAINTTAALTRLVKSQPSRQGVGLIDLDLRLPTISSILDSHPKKTFYDLFETLDNKSYQVEFLRTVYMIISWFGEYLEGEVKADDKKLAKILFKYQNLNYELFRYEDFPFGDALHELFMERMNVPTVNQIKILEPLLKKFDLKELRSSIRDSENNSWPVLAEYINFIEEYGFSFVGGEVPILGKRLHRKRINQPEFLLLFLKFLEGVVKQFDYVVLDTPAGGVNHLSSLMNMIDQVLFIFDLSNTIAVNGSIDALHSFIDYYEDFQKDARRGTLTGLDKEYVDRVISEQGQNAVFQSLKNKKLGILFNRCQDSDAIKTALGQLREYLDTLDKYQQYKNRIHIVGMVPNHTIINITNNRRALFYDLDLALTGKMDQIARSIVSGNENCPTLGDTDKEIIRYLKAAERPPIIRKLTQIAGNIRAVSNLR